MKLLQLLTFSATIMLSIPTNAQWQEPTDPVVFHNLRCDGASEENMGERLIINANTSNGGHAVNWSQGNPNNAQVIELTHWSLIGFTGAVYFTFTDPSHFYFVFDDNQTWYYLDGMSQGRYSCMDNGGNGGTSTTTTNAKKSKK